MDEPGGLPARHRSVGAAAVREASSAYNIPVLLAGHQPNYLPYLGFFHKAAQVDRFVIVDNVQFVKRGPFGWIHRNRVLTVHGPRWLTVPVLTKGRYTQTIDETRINNALPWPRKHWRTIETNYGRAPHFARYAPVLAAVYEKPWERLAALNAALIQALLAAFDIDVPVDVASAHGVSGKGSDYVLDLCRRFGADAYLSGIHGRDYLDVARFRREGIDLRFQTFTHPVYPQQGGGPFVPNLSAIDLLFNCGPDSRAILLGEGGGR